MAFTTEVLDEILRGYHGSRVDFNGSLFGQRSMRAAIGLWLAMKGNLPLGGVSKFDKIHGAVYYKQRGTYEHDRVL